MFIIFAFPFPWISALGEGRVGVGDLGAVLGPSVVTEQSEGKWDPEGDRGPLAAGSWHGSETVHVELGAFWGKTKHQSQSSLAGEPTSQQSKGADFYLFICVFICDPRAHSQIPLAIACTGHSTSWGHLLMARGWGSQGFL